MQRTGVLKTVYMYLYENANERCLHRWRGRLTPHVGVVVGVLLLLPGVCVLLLCILRRGRHHRTGKGAKLRWLLLLLLLWVLAKCLLAHHYTAIARKWTACWLWRVGSSRRKGHASQTRTALLRGLGEKSVLLLQLRGSKVRCWLLLLEI